MKHSQNIKVNEHDIKYLVVVQSHPMRVRGLKHECPEQPYKPVRRTPCGCVD